MGHLELLSCCNAKPKNTESAHTVFYSLRKKLSKLSQPHAALKHEWSFLLCRFLSYVAMFLYPFAPPPPTTKHLREK